MGANGGGGMGSSPHEMAGQMGNGSSQPAATEYTLQGLSLLPPRRGQNGGPEAVAAPDVC
jgi:hypothetical protein